MSQARAQLRSDDGANERDQDERVAEVYPFPRYTERRTIQITGQATPPPRRRQSPTVSRMSARPDRIAMYAVLLGLVLIVMAILTAHG
jgi:hypothetical protein